MNRGRGFTLLELLVALALLALIAVLIGGALRGGVLGLDQGRELSAAAESRRAVLAFLRARLAAARPWIEPARAEAGFRSGVQFVGEAQRMSLIATMPRALNGGALHRIDLRLDEGAHLTVAWHTLRAGDDSGRARRLAGPLRGFALAYFGRLGDDPGPRWHEAWREARDLPLAIRVRIVDSRGAWPDLVVAPARQRQR